MSDRTDVVTMDKPDLVVARANGTVRLVGVEKAAAWLGMAASTVRNISAGRGPAMGYSERTIRRVEGEYPQIVGALRRPGCGLVGTGGT